MKTLSSLLRLSLTLLLALGSAAVQAHEVRPAYLELVQSRDQTLNVLFKQPSTTSMTVRLDPEISGLELKPAAAKISTGLGFQIRQWNKIPLGAQGLGERKVTIHGLDRSITDTLLVVRYADGHELQEILKPERESITLDIRGDTLPIKTYLSLGVEHILTGYDHLAFVLGLVLLVSGLAPLFKTITAFTVAHSITLAVTALGVIEVQPAKIETLVALSIVFVALELANLRRGKPSITQRWPWLIAFCFGLLHGSAFAGALSEIGLPHSNIPLALFLFNVGVEIGQLLFVSVVLTVIFVSKR